MLWVLPHGSLCDLGLGHCILRGGADTVLGLLMFPRAPWTMPSHLLSPSLQRTPRYGITICEHRCAFVCVAVSMCIMGAYMSAVSCTVYTCSVGEFIPATGWGGAAKHMVQVCVFTGVCIACLCVPSCVSTCHERPRRVPKCTGDTRARPQSSRREGALTKERAALSTYEESPRPFLGRAMSTRVWAA